MITIQQITWNNVDDVYELEVEESQKNFVATNSYSLMEAYASVVDDSVPTRHAFAICNGEEVVGFMMIFFDVGENNSFKDDDQPFYFFNRFMIGKQFQGRGYGKAAMALIIEHVKNWPQGKAASFYTSFEPENEVARKLYADFGFVETGEIKWDEIVTRLVF